MIFLNHFTDLTSIFNQTDEKSLKIKRGCANKGEECGTNFNGDYLNVVRNNFAVCRGWRITCRVRKNMCYTGLTQQTWVKPGYDPHL